MNPVSFQPVLTFRKPMVRFGDTRPESPEDNEPITLLDDTKGSARLLGLLAASMAVSSFAYLHLFSAIKKVVVGE